MIFGAYLAWLFNGIVIFFAAYWGLFTVIGAHSISKARREEFPVDKGELPRISILVAVKNEERTLERLIKTIKELNYPANLVETVFVLDGVKDRSFDIINSHISELDIKAIVRETDKDRKAGALNYGLKYCKGDLIAFLDADSVPNKDYLLDAAREYLKGRKAMTGYYRIINTGESWLSKLSIFEALTSRALNYGRYKLGLSVPIAGYNSFVDRKLLLDIGGFKKSATEDIDIWLKLLETNVKTSYFDSYVWIESPARVLPFLKQRMRWYGGYLQLIKRHLKLFKITGIVSSLDAIIFLLMPIYSILLLITVSFTPIAIYLWSAGIPRVFFFSIYLFAYFGTVQMSSLGSFIKLRDELKGTLGSLPLTYIYMGLLSVASLAALIAVIFKHNIIKFKTEKTGYTDVSAL